MKDRTPRTLKALKAMEAFNRIISGYIHCADLQSDIKIGQILDDIEDCGLFLARATLEELGIDLDLKPEQFSLVAEAAELLALEALKSLKNSEGSESVDPDRDEPPSVDYLDGFKPGDHVRLKSGEEFVNDYGHRERSTRIESVYNNFVILKNISRPQAVSDVEKIPDFKRGDKVCFSNVNGLYNPVPNTSPYVVTETKLNRQSSRLTVKVSGRSNFYAADRFRYALSDEHREVGHKVEAVGDHRDELTGDE